MTLSPAPAYFIVLMPDKMSEWHWTKFMTGFLLLRYCLPDMIATSLI